MCLPVFALGSGRGFGSGFKSVGVGFDFCGVEDGGGGDEQVVARFAFDDEGVGQVGVEAHDSAFVVVEGITVGELVGDEPDARFALGAEHVVVEAVVDILRHLRHPLDVLLPAGFLGDGPQVRFGFHGLREVGAEPCRFEDSGLDVTFDGESGRGVRFGFHIGRGRLRLLRGG